MLNSFYQWSFDAYTHMHRPSVLDMSISSWAADRAQLRCIHNINREILYGILTLCGRIELWECFGDVIYPEGLETRLQAWWVLTLRSRCCHTCNAQKEVFVLKQEHNVKRLKKLSCMVLEEAEGWVYVYELAHVTMMLKYCTCTPPNLKLLQNVICFRSLRL